MPFSCCVPNCNSRYSKAKKVKLFRFPSNPERCHAWIRAVRREKWLPNRHTRICQFHFVSRKPCHFLLYSTSAKLGQPNRTWIANWPDRLQKRRKQKEHQSAPPLGSETATSSELHQECDLQENVQTIDSMPLVSLDLHNSEQELGLEEQQDSAQCASRGSNECQILISDIDLEATKQQLLTLEESERDLKSKYMEVENKLKNKEELYANLEVKLKEVNQKLHQLEEKNSLLHRDLYQTSSIAVKMQNDDKRTHFYTGLPSYNTFAVLLSLLIPVVSKMGNVGYGLSMADELVLVLTKLSRAVTNEDLGYRFDVDKTKVTKNFHRWIDVMFQNLKPLVCWPDKEMIVTNLPDCFKPHYAKAVCIIDCSEVFIQRPTCYTARAQTYSNYKNHNTIKFLVAISPTGAVTFISRCWGGRVSDRYLTANSGLLRYLKHGDLVIADRGFDIADDLALVGAILAIPPFTKGKSQLSQREVEFSRRLSSVRIHVERAIGRMKNYKILQCTLPISLIKRDNETEFATIDKILLICAALSNLHPPLVK